MKLYLVQHAAPMPKEEDPERPLSEAGWSDIRRIAHFATHYLAVDVVRILHSGKLRALQTAEVLCDALRPSGGCTAEAGLAPLDDPSIWVRRIPELDHNIMIVGHLPHLSRLAAELIDATTPREVVRFQQGGIVCLATEENEWRVEWMIGPAVLR
jgi:phosphohistidine phosphatase